MADPGAPNVAAFIGGVELGVFASLLTVSALAAVAAVRRILAV